MGQRDDSWDDAIKGGLFQQKLEHRREILIRDQSDSRDSRDPVELDQTRVGRLSRMDALQDQAMAMETARRRDIELKRTEAALERMVEGDYGYCVQCGCEIELKRLELDPSVPTCIDCASR